MDFAEKTKLQRYLAKVDSLEKTLRQAFWELEKLDKETRKDVPEGMDKNFVFNNDMRALEISSMTKEKEYVTLARMVRSRVRGYYHYYTAKDLLNEMNKENKK